MGKELVIGHNLFISRYVQFIVIKNYPAVGVKEKPKNYE